MKHSFLPILSAFLLAADPALRAANPAPIPAPAGEFDFAADQKRHEAEVDKIEFDSEVALETLLAQYLSRLELLRQGAQREGDLLGVVAVEQEVARVKSTRAPEIPSNGPPAGLPALARSFSESWSRQEKHRESLRETAVTRRRETLEARMKTLTQAGKLEEAGVIWQALQKLKQPVVPPPQSSSKIRPVSVSDGAAAAGLPAVANPLLSAAYPWLEGVRFFTYKSGNAANDYRGKYSRRNMAELVFQPEGGAILLNLPQEKTTHWKLVLGRKPLSPGDECEVEASGIFGLQLVDNEDLVNSLIAFDGKKTNLHRYRIRRTKEGAQFWVDGSEVKSPLRKGSAESAGSTFAKADLFPCLKVRTEDKPVLHKVTFTAGTGAP